MYSQNLQKVSDNKDHKAYLFTNDQEMFAIISSKFIMNVYL